MWVYRSLGSWSCKTRHYSSRHRNDYDGISEVKVCKCLRESNVVNIGILRPATIRQVSMEVLEVVVIGLKRPDPLPQVIAEVVETGQY